MEQEHGVEQEREFTVFEKFSDFMENNTRGVKLITYGIAGTGLCFALYRIRPFTKFKKPSDVPCHFLQQRVPLKGMLKRINPQHGFLFLVDHKPLLPLPRFNSNNYLPIKVARINVTPNGVSWLQTLVNGKEITFIPIAWEKNYLDCIVTVALKDKEIINVGEELVKLGFATVHPLQDCLLKDKDVLRYHKRLVNAQKFAERKRNGEWHFLKRPTFLWKLQVLLSDKLRSMLPIFILKHLNI